MHFHAVFIAYVARTGSGKFIESEIVIEGDHDAPKGTAWIIIIIGRKRLNISGGCDESGRTQFVRSLEKSRGQFR